MTIIVADSKLRMMVADTLVSHDGYLCYHTPKVVRCDDGALAGASGDVAGALKFLSWARNGRLGEAAFEGCSGIVMAPDGTIYLHEDSHHCETPMGGWAAIGHGAPMAIAARAVGATPQQQVKAAIAASLVCGGKVQVFRLKK